VVSHAVLGIQGQTALVEQGGAEYPVGVLVETITTGSSYQVGGGQINDVITDLDGVPIATMDGLLTVMRTKRSGDEVTISVSRSEADLDLEITLGTLEP
jgi:S1-C subfamily serine protease